MVTRTATYLSASDTPNSSIGALGFTPSVDFNGTVQLDYVITDGNGGYLDTHNSFNVSPVNDEPVRINGNVGTFFLVEDQPLTSMGLEDLTYSVGGGADESTTVGAVAAQTLTYTIDAVPATNKGTIYVKDALV